MAANDQLRLLQSGAESWNAWRQENPDIDPDLESADLRGANLSECDLASADLSDSDLNGANLTYARLQSSDLSRVNLDHADLSHANLEGAALNFANLRETNLSGANLCLANLQGADLRGANLEGAAFGHSLLANTCLADTKQIERCRFLAPVSTDFRTLVRSVHIPVAFLRGCGVPEELIENLPNLFTKPIQSYSVFVQGVEEDRMFVNSLCPDLQQRGIRCWVLGDPSNTKENSSTFETVQDRYFQSGSSSRLLVISKNTVGVPWLEREARLFLKNERLYNLKLLFAVRLDDSMLRWQDSALESTLNSRAIDFRWWKNKTSYNKALDNLVASVSS